MAVYDFHKWDVGLLGSALGSSFGPLAREKLLLTAARKAVLTCSGASILSSIVSQHPIESLMLEAASAHEQIAGDGVKAYALMLDAARAEVGQQLQALPKDRQAAWRVRLSRAVFWLQLEVLPHNLTECWREQAVRTLDGEDAFRADAYRVAATALGVQLGASASASLSEALIEAVLPARAATLPPGGAATWQLDGTVARARCLALVAAPGAQPSRSCATAGRIIGGTPSSELMPVFGKDGVLLLLGAHAAAPEVQTAAEARAVEAGVPAEVVVSADQAPAGGMDSAAVTCNGIDSAAGRWVDFVHASREAWVQTAHAAGVRLLLSGAPLSALTVQLCAQHGVCAVPGVDEDDLRALATAAGISILQRWPRSAELTALLTPTAGFAQPGCSFECLRLGGRGYVRVQLASAPQLCSLVVRASSPGLANEYAAAVGRALRSLRLWLDAGRTRTDADAKEWGSRVLLALPGAGAAEMQLEASVRRLVAAQKQARTNASATALLPEQTAVLQILSAALLAPVRQVR